MVSSLKASLFQSESHVKACFLIVFPEKITVFLRYFYYEQKLLNFAQIWGEVWFDRKVESLDAADICRQMDLPNVETTQTVLVQCIL